MATVGESTGTRKGRWYLREYRGGRLGCIRRSNTNNTDKHKYLQAKNAHTV
jgi:hypothetical protein